MSRAFRSFVDRQDRTRYEELPLGEEPAVPGTNQSMTGKTKQSPKTKNERKPTARSATPKRHATSARADAKASGVLGVVATVLFVAAGSVWAWSCSRDKPTPPPIDTATRAQPAPSHAQPTTAPEPEPPEQDAGPSDASAGLDPDAPWEGPWVGALVPTAPVYVSTFRTRENMIGYLRYGTKAPATSTKPLMKDNCKEGWYRLHPHGYICGSHATPDLTSARFQAGTTPPDIEAVVPYKYAYNNRNGTPLYRRIPTAEEMDTYEPDRPRSDAKTKGAKTKRSSSSDAGDDARAAHAPPHASALASAIASALAPAHSAPRIPKPATSAPLPLLPLPGEDPADQGNAPQDAGLADASEEVKPWWMRPDAGKEDLTLDHMLEGSDAVMAKRMARGFFVAVDKTFRKNGRLWHKTTEGLVAPSDRMSINSPPTFRGVELIGAEAPSLPVGWTRVSAAKYMLADDGKTFRRKGSVDRFTMVPLTGKTMKQGETLYREAKDGFWLKGTQVGVTDPGPPPSGLRPDERWVDVNLSTQTLVAFEGDKPVFATMVSTGKKGQTKKTDHSTVKGTFRVREKHVTATMDGDGAAPGEGPYSIQDVPYILYFERSYAIHGAFWHNNFGTRMSHGCVNMSPLDAKRIFFWSAPLVPPGWHGAWSTKDMPGSFVVVHD
jgi:hypothetical protein